MATPMYQGPGQPLAGNGGLFGGLGGFFGVATPAYAGSGQPTSAASSLGRGTPAYAPAPATSVCVSDAATGDIAQGTVPCPIDPAALAEGRIAIVIPRSDCGCP